MIDLTEYIPSEDTQEFIWDVLSWRDDLVRTISSAIESIPGFSELLDELMDAINECKQAVHTMKCWTNSCASAQVVRRLPAPTSPIRSSAITGIKRGNHDNGAQLISITRVTRQI